MMIMMRQSLHGTSSSSSSLEEKEKSKEKKKEKEENLRIKLYLDGTYTPLSTFVSSLSSSSSSSLSLPPTPPPSSLSIPSSVQQQSLSQKIFSLQEFLKTFAIESAISQRDLNRRFGLKLDSVDSETHASLIRDPKIVVEKNDYGEIVYRYHSYFKNKGELYHYLTYQQGHPINREEQRQKIKDCYPGYLEDLEEMRRCGDLIAVLNYEEKSNMKSYYTYYPRTRKNTFLSKLSGKVKIQRHTSTLECEIDIGEEIAPGEIICIQKEQNNNQKQTIQKEKEREK